MSDKNYSFRLTRITPAKYREWLDRFLADAEGNGFYSRSDALVALIVDAINLRTGWQPVEGRGDYTEIRNEVSQLKQWVMDLMNDPGRIQAIAEAHEQISAGNDIPDDVLDNILEGFERE